MRIRDWSSDVCLSDLFAARVAFTAGSVPAELGQSARVFIQTGDQVSLSVPLSALTAENGATYVWVVNANNTLKKAPVRVGPFGEKTVPVLEGLSPNDWVVAAGVHVLLDGQQNGRASCRARGCKYV